MDISLLILNFVSFFSIFFVAPKKDQAVFSNLRLAFVKASLVVSLLVVIFTESLSFFKILTFTHVVLSWSVSLAISSAVLVLLIKKNKFSFKKLYLNKIVSFFKGKGLFTKVVVLLIFIVLISLFCVAFTINSNWDSYTYHLPRVEHFIQNGNVEFYPTNNIRQLYLAPFSEYFILHIRLLSGNVLFVNFVQFISLINCLLLASLVAKLFGLSVRGQIAALILALTIPMGLLQATTTQTDLVVSFFLISFVYFGIAIAKEKRLSTESLFFLCLSFSLGILTKSTFYPFAFPFCLLFGIYYLRLFRARVFLILFSALLLFLLLNFPFLNRNYRQFGSPLGPQKTAPYYLASLNEGFGVKETLSNTVKNIGLHLAIPNRSWNTKIDRLIATFHKLINFPLNSPTTSWPGAEYKTIFLLDHDHAGNFFHVSIFFIAIGIMMGRFKTIPNLQKTYLFSVISGFLLFALLLKWQPWQTRLDLPLFFLLSPFLAYALSLINWQAAPDLVCTVLLLVSIGILFICDPAKPILGENSIFLKGNHSYIFDYDATRKIALKIKKYKISNIGLILGGNSWEWQYWLLIKDVKMENIFFYKDLLGTPNFNIDFNYQAAIIENNFLKIPRINELISKKENILKTVNTGERVTLVIFKTQQGKTFAY